MATLTPGFSRLAGPHR